jgi:hypothetical protein
LAGRPAVLPHGGVAVVAQAQPAAHDLAGQVQDGGVVVQDEVGVGGQDDPVQLEGERGGVLVCGKFVLLNGGGGEAAEHVHEPGLEAGDKGGLLPNAELAGTVQLWEWIGDEGATTFSY